MADQVDVVVRLDGRFDGRRVVRGEVLRVPARVAAALAGTGLVALVPRLPGPGRYRRRDMAAEGGTRGGDD